MPTIATIGAGFLLSVLWFDLMFDVQTRRHPSGTIPADILASISAYYGRVTTGASPMNLLVSAMMLTTLIGIAGEIWMGTLPTWMTWSSLAMALTATLLGALSAVPSAVRLGKAQDTPEEQSRLARQVYRDHQICFAAMLGVVIVQIAGAFV